MTERGSPGPPRAGVRQEDPGPAASDATAPRAATSREAAPGRSPETRRRRDADFSRAVLEDLYRYPRKRNWIARILWLPPMGIFGAHRFYLDRTGTGLIQLFSAGGAGAWWLVDAFLIPGIVRSINEDQAARKQQGLPPRALSFMPPLRGAFLPSVPEWAVKRGGKGRLVPDMILLFLFGSLLGANVVSTGNPEPVLAVVALVAITLLGARWDALTHIPIVAAFDRWNHRLRLFYYVTDPGGPLKLAFRPIFGVIVAPFRKRARAESRLYLQLGVWFTVIFTTLDVIQSVSSGGGLFLSPLSLLGDMIQTLGTVYLFAAPIGAILTTHLLLERTDRLIWALSAISLAGVLIGMLGMGPLN